MKSIIRTGKTVDDAVNEALKILGASRENTIVEVLEEPRAGFLGIIGSKDAVVKVSVKKKEFDMSDLVEETLYGSDSASKPEKESQVIRSCYPEDFAAKLEEDVDKIMTQVDERQTGLNEEEAEETVDLLSAVEKSQAEQSFKDSLAKSDAHARREEARLSEEEAEETVDLMDAVEKGQAEEGFRDSLAESDAHARREEARLTESEAMETVDLLDAFEKAGTSRPSLQETTTYVASKEDPDFVPAGVVLLMDIIKGMDIEADASYREVDGFLNIDIIDVSERDTGIIIGRRGETLDAIQYLVSLAENKAREEYVRIFLNINSYREKRESSLISLAGKMANKAKKTGRIIRLEPMNSYERRIIHKELQNYDGISTSSEGREPYRRVLIKVNK